MSKENKSDKNKSRKSGISGMQTDLFVEELLMDGEEIIVNCDVHWGIYWKSACIIIFALLLMIFIWQIGMILLVAGIIGVIHSFIMQKMLLLTLTNKRVLMRYGILQVDVVSMRFKNIESIELERMLPGFVFGFSNVVVMGIGQRFVVIPYLANGVEFRRAFNELTLDDEEEYEETIVEEEDTVKSAGKGSRVIKKIRRKRKTISDTDGKANAKD